MTDKQWIEFLKESIASHDRQSGELTDPIAAQTANIHNLVAMRNREGVDKRLGNLLEGGRA